MKAVIMAGGRGTRIANLYPDIPKPMIEVAGKPLLLHQLDWLQCQGIYDITIVVGYLGHIIKNYFKDRVNYIEEHSPLGTAGALYWLRETMQEDFLLINGDIMLDICLERMIKYHKKKGGLATILAHPNDHPFDSGLIECNLNGGVISWYAKEDNRPVWYRNLTNAGVHILSPKLLSRFKEPKKTDLDRDILKPLITEGKLFAYISPEYTHDVGTPERLKKADLDFRSGRIKTKNLANKQKAVFIDRDGTINKAVGYISRPEQFELIDGTSKVIRNINNSEYLAICVTNQPIIARGELDFAGLQTIHNKMETILGENGAYLDDILFCPHHPDSGFEGERKELKIVCNCRKPNIGMLEQAVKKYNIDLTQSIMVGDSLRDRQTAERANCKEYFVSLKAFDDWFCHK